MVVASACPGSPVLVRSVACSPEKVPVFDPRIVKSFKVLSSEPLTQFVYRNLFGDIAFPAPRSIVIQCGNAVSADIHRLSPVATLSKAFHVEYVALNSESADATKGDGAVLLVMAVDGSQVAPPSAEKSISLIVERVTVVPTCAVMCKRRKRYGAMLPTSVPKPTKLLTVSILVIV